MKTINHRRQAHRGTQVAELAVVLPLLAFLALVVSEGAGIIRAHQVVNNAAREGARISATTSAISTTTVSTAVADYACFNYVQLVGASPSACSTATFKPSVTCRAAGSGVAVNQAFTITTASGVSETASQITVTCSYPLTYLPALSFPSLGISVPNSIPLKATATFRNLY
jgi:Flp pilus assembly protein TadG